MADQNENQTDGAGDFAAIDTPPVNTSFRPEGDLGGEDVTFDSAADAAPDKPAASATSTATQTIKDNAAKLTQTVSDRAKTYAEDGKARAGTALDELAQMMHDAAGTVDQKVGAQYGQYARTAAEAVTGFSESLKSKNVDDLIADATGFVKKSPAIAVGTAAAIGFVLIRLVQSGLNADNDPA